MTITQILFILLAIIMIMSIFIQLQRDKIAVVQAVIWWIIWFSVVVLTLFYTHVQYLTRQIGISQPIDFIIYTSILLLFVIVYRQQIKQELFNRQLTKLVRELAISHSSIALTKKKYKR